MVQHPEITFCDINVITDDINYSVFKLNVQTSCRQIMYYVYWLHSKVKYFEYRKPSSRYIRQRYDT